MKTEGKKCRFYYINNSLKISFKPAGKLDLCPVLTVIDAAKKLIFADINNYNVKAINIYHVDI